MSQELHAEIQQLTSNGGTQVTASDLQQVAADNLSAVQTQLHAEITTVGTCGEDQLQLQGGEGLWVEPIANDDITDDGFYVDDAGAFVQFPAQPDPDWATKHWDDPRTLEDLRSAKREAIKAARDRAIASGVTWDGDLFQSDAESRSWVSGAVQMAALAIQNGVPYSNTWILANNSTRELDGSQMVQLGMAFGVFVKDNFTKYQVLQARIATATAEQLGEITWDS